jgi:hypothetical protein
LIFLPGVLVWRSIAIYFFPCLFVYASRALRALFSLLGLIECCRFEDKNFTGASAIDIAEYNDAAWVRAVDIEAGLKRTALLFEGKIQAADLVQGGVGDCWLISAIACMAVRVSTGTPYCFRTTHIPLTSSGVPQEHPSAIRNIFLDEERTARGKYSFRLYDAPTKKWETVVIDDTLPVDKEKRLCFAKMQGSDNTNELWAVLLEKAVAKFAGSYGRLDGNHPEWAWQAFTGDEILHLTKNSEDLTNQTWRLEKMTVEPSKDGQRSMDFSWSEGGQAVASSDLANILLGYTQRGAVLGAWMDKGTGMEAVADNGLVNTHAYSVLDVRRIGRSASDILHDTHTSGYTILRLRNPWGKSEWTGAFSDNDSIWQAHPDFAKEIGVDEKDDGAFWIDLGNFVANFSHVSICDRTVKNDLRLNTHEECLFCGPAYGCIKGCALFWCLCKGLRTIYCGARTSSELRRGETVGYCGCCAADIKDGIVGAAREVQREARVAVRTVVTNSPLKALK